MRRSDAMRIAVGTCLLFVAAAFVAPAAQAGIGLKLPQLYKTAYQPFKLVDPSFIVDDLDFRNRHPEWGSEFEGPGWMDPCGYGNGSLEGDPDPAASLHCGVGWGRAGVRPDYHYITRITQDFSETATFTPPLEKDGIYEVWIGWICTENRAADTRFTVFHNEGRQRYSVNGLQGNSNYGFQNTWARLGKFPFKAGNKGYVVLKNNPNSHSEGIDAVGFRYISALGPYTISGTVTSGGNPVVGATVAVGGGIDPATTAADGTYTLAQIPYWFSGTVTATKASLSFAPVAVSKVKSNRTVNFTAE